MDNMNGMGGSPMGGMQPGGMPGAQPMQSVQPIQPATPQYGGVPGANNMNTVPVMPGGPGMPMVQQVQAPLTPKKDISGLVKTIVIIVLSLLAVTFIGLFIWAAIERSEAQSDVESKIAVAVAEAKDEQAMKDEADRLETEKYPYKTFAGPVDYGQLTFEYPKTWSVYVAAAAASSTGDFNAYFNPVQVDAVGKETVNALRLTIRDKTFDEVAAEYQKAMEKKNSNLTMESVTIGRDANITANRYTGTIPNTELSGYIVVFKIRDKTAVLQTDSTLFADDFNKLLGTVTFNE